MSYCRWSSDNWKSDLYCYESVHGGWYTHVAGMRYVGEAPSIDWRAAPSIVDAAHKAVRAFMENCERASIGLPHDGETFVDTSVADFHARLLMLRQCGYHVPDHAIAEAESEISAAEDAA